MDQPKQRKVLRIKNWNEFFETAKTKTYKIRNNCTMPNKHGLGYRVILANKGGEAVFGAWSSMVQVLSRQQAPRNGYLTDDGTRTGRPYDHHDISALTGFSPETCEKMLSLAQSQKVGWIEIVYIADTTRTLQGPVVSLQYPLNSNLNLNSNIEDAGASSCSDLEAAPPRPEPPHKRIRFDRDSLAFSGITEDDRERWREAYPAIDLSAEIAAARNWLIANPRKATKSNYSAFLTNWFKRAQDRGGGMRSNPAQSADQQRHSRFK